MSFSYQVSDAYTNDVFRGYGGMEAGRLDKCLEQINITYLPTLALK